MGNLNLLGSLTGGPRIVSDTGQFPSATYLVGLGWSNSNDKPFDVGTGVLQRNVDSPAAFVQLYGVGATDAVTQGSTLYFKTTNSFQLRLTCQNPQGADIVSIVPVSGLVMLEFPDDSYLKLLECMGSGPIEYLVVGPV